MSLSSGERSERNEKYGIDDMDDITDLITLRIITHGVWSKIPVKAHVLVDTTEALKSALDDMRNDKVFALDCEGVNLGR